MSKISLSAFARAIAAAAILTLSGGAQANIVTNGGFETGDFTGWNAFGNTGFSGVTCPGPSPAVHSGSCSAFFGPVGSLGGIFQTLATAPGATYQIDFWFEPDGGVPSSFEFNWDGGAAEVSLLNPPSAAFTPYSFMLVASSASTDLRFGFRDDPGFLFLDDVSVVAVVPEPGSLALLGLGLLGFAVSRRRRQ